MNKDWLKELFINEAKPALNRQQGGGTTTGKIPTKLSDLENDLWWSKRELFLTLTENDFVPWETPDGEIIYLYISSPKLDWLTSVDTIAWEYSATSEGETFTLDSDSVYCECHKEFTDDGAIATVYMGDFPFSIQSGFDYKNLDEVISKDEFFIIAYPIDHFELKIYRIDAKKIPIEYCDTSEIEDAINAITKEVLDL